MDIVRNIAQLRQKISFAKKEQKTIGFVPTMGALHEGHLSLVDIARDNADIVVVSIFVNPKQFAANEDLTTYPRNEAGDLQLLKEKKVDIVYLPEVLEIYPDNFDLTISVGEIGKDLEGVSRPHFFDGVAIVVTKLFLQVTPDIAVFGEKDYQQLTIIKKLVDGLNFPIKIIAGAIARDENGLALSSRNSYLSKAALKTASGLNKTLLQIKEKIKNGEDIESAKQWGKQELVKLGFQKVDYIEVRNDETLSKIYNNTNNMRILAAAYIENVRLIDNIAI